MSYLFDCKLSFAFLYIPIIACRFVLFVSLLNMQLHDYVKVEAITGKNDEAIINFEKVRVNSSSKMLSS